jgi:hypothetical protein
LIRSVAVLIAAISLSRPGIPKEEAARYAHALNASAREYDFDPLTAVAIIHFETRWRPNLISSDGEDYGLGQVRARFLGPCRDDEDPVNAPSEGCKAAKASLLDGTVNIRRMATIISANRDLCREKTGTAKAFQWLAGYQGRNQPSKDVWCKPAEGTWRVLAYREELIAKVLPKPKSRSPHAGNVVAAKAAAGSEASRRASTSKKGATRR